MFLVVIVNEFKVVFVESGVGIFRAVCYFFISFFKEVLGCGIDNI